MNILEHTNSNYIYDSFMIINPWKAHYLEILQFRDKFFFFLNFKYRLLLETRLINQLWGLGRGDPVSNDRNNVRASEGDVKGTSWAPPLTVANVKFVTFFPSLNAPNDCDQPPTCNSSVNQDLFSSIKTCIYSTDIILCWAKNTVIVCSWHSD